MFGVDGVGVSLSLPGTLRAVVGGSNEAARQLEYAQLTSAEGPCTAATWTGRPVHAADLSDPAETRWPVLVQQLAGLPVRAVTAVPLTIGGAALGETAVGSLDLHSTRAHGLDGLDADALEAVATMMAAAVLHLRTPDPRTAAPGTVDWADVQRATDRVAAALGIAPLDALDRLRARAFRESRWLPELAADVLTGRQAADLGDAPTRPAG